MKDYRLEAMNALEVYVNERGNVSIKEEIPHDDDLIVEVTRDRLPILIAWLQEIQMDIVAGKYDDESDGTEA